MQNLLNSGKLKFLTDYLIQNNNIVETEKICSDSLSFKFPEHVNGFFEYLTYEKFAHKRKFINVLNQLITNIQHKYLQPMIIDDCIDLIQSYLPCMELLPGTIKIPCKDTTKYLIVNGGDLTGKIIEIVEEFMDTYESQPPDGDGDDDDDSDGYGDGDGIIEVRKYITRIIYTEFNALYDKLRIFALNYNVMRIMAGMPGLAYRN